MRGDQIVRQWRIIQSMETRRYGISVAELAEELESQPRTIYRDLEALYNAGFPLTRMERILSGSCSTHSGKISGFLLQSQS
jgi:predicted DNA-binding transcriptional regulator YafY